MSVGGRSSEGIAHYDVKKRKAAIAAALIMVQATTTVIGMASVLRDLTALEASAISRRMRKFVHKRHLDRVTKPSEPVERRAHYGTDVIVSTTTCAPTARIGPVILELNLMSLGGFAASSASRTGRRRRVSKMEIGRPGSSLFQLLWPFACISSVVDLPLQN